MPKVDFGKTYPQTFVADTPPRTTLVHDSPPSPVSGAMVDLRRLLAPTAWSFAPFVLKPLGCVAAASHLQISVLFVA